MTIIEIIIGKEHKMSRVKILLVLSLASRVSKKIVVPSFASQVFRVDNCSGLRVYD